MIIHFSVPAGITSVLLLLLSRVIEANYRPKDPGLQNRDKLGNLSLPPSYQI